MGWIYLEAIQVKAPVGVSKVERMAGSNLSITVGVKRSLIEAGETDQLEKSIDYGEINRKVRECLSEPCQLLETVGIRIRDSIFRSYPEVKKIKLEIRKLEPPIGGKCKAAVIRMKFQSSN